jgi:hypothetical protein
MMDFMVLTKDFFDGIASATASKKYKVRFIKGAFYGQRRFSDWL